MAVTPLSIPERFQPALAALLTSFDYAQDSGADAWQFAIDLPELLATGATLADLRWLIHRGFAEHAKETTIAGDPTRTFRPLARTNFPDDACVVLTTAGAAAIRSTYRSVGFQPASSAVENPRTVGFQPAEPENPPLRKGGQGGSHGSGVGFQPASATVEKPRGVGFQPASSAAEHPRGGFQPAAAPPPLKPRYDAMLHELRLGDEIVKCFTRPAPAQELILAVFEEEGWPPAIDDPLTSPTQDPKRHLHYTIRNLNRGQEPLRIRFYINGHGETIRWEIIPSARQQRAISAPAEVADFGDPSYLLLSSRSINCGEEIL